jgi:hypothetical protein
MCYLISFGGKKSVCVVDMGSDLLVFETVGVIIEREKD